LSLQDLTSDNRTIERKIEQSFTKGNIKHTCLQIKEAKDKPKTTEHNQQSCALKNLAFCSNIKLFLAFRHVASVVYWSRRQA